jgi:nucleotide-binding universal stress UspA family protein
MRAAQAASGQGILDMRVLFVPVADRPECAVALNKAFELAGDLGATVVGCHIRPHSYTDVSLPATLTDAAIGADAEWRAAWKPKARQQTAPAARTLFVRMAERKGFDMHKTPRAKPGAIWMEKTGTPQRVIGIMGPVSDLLVVSRPEGKDGSIARLFLVSALMASSRPVLVLPQAGEWTVGKRICIAWNQSKDAALAVASALPLLQLAQHVCIISSGTENRPGPKSSQLAAYLKCWGVQTERVTTRGNDDSKEILSTFRSMKSDLLVMGAYSRSRFSQMIFGGVTDHMLNRASIPVLVRHG